MAGGGDAPRAWLLGIGSELLLGETVDTNSAFLGGELARAGAEVVASRHLADSRALIADAFREARAAADLVVVTGGLGPTHDDLTREGLAEALDEALSPDPSLEARLRERFSAYGAMPASNLRQAMLIPSAEPLANPIGSAPGWWVDRSDGAVVVLMPGVPSEMRRMWNDEVSPRLRARFGLRPLHMRTVKTFGLGESTVADRLGTLLSEPPPGVDAGIYARDDGVHLRFSTRGDPAVLDPLAERTAELVGEHAWGLDDDDLAAVALAALGRAGASTVSSWEADTHGALLAILSAASPAEGSARYMGGLLDAGGAAAAPVADAVIQLSLLPQDANGRSRVRVAVSGSPSLPMEELRIHGSGPQRLRRAAFAALDRVRHALTGAS
ncbi:MAG TPA: molybdopterin-binding protein [Candidatus Limnocylindria bacterium]